MSDSTFKPGDVVVLRSGGPHMTVESAAGLVGCIWFPSLDGPPQTRMFEAAVLKGVDARTLGDTSSP